MTGALTRFRVIAYVVGAFLLLLTAGVVLRYGYGEPTLSHTVSPIHGFLYMVYLVAVFDLGRRVGWSVPRMGLVMLAGTVPFLSFYVERVVRRRWVPSVDGRRAGDPPVAPVVTGPAGGPRVSADDARPSTGGASATTSTSAGGSGS